MMSVSQLRAARALLNFSQAQVAALGGISTTSLSAIEREAKTPRVKTINRLQSVLEAQGVEFTEGHGVRLSDHMFDIKIYPKKQASSLEYHQDILATLKTKGGEFLAVSNDDTYAEPELRKVQFEYFRQMLKNGWHERIILPENNGTCYGPKQVSQYRLLRPDLFGRMETSLYGDKFVINEPKRVVVIHSKVISENFRKQFEFYWAMAKPVSNTTPRLFEQDLKKWGK